MAAPPGGQGARLAWGKQGARLPWLVYCASLCRSRLPSCPLGGKAPRGYDVVVVPIVRVDKWPLLLVGRAAVYRGAVGRSLHLLWGASHVLLQK